MLSGFRCQGCTAVAGTWQPFSLPHAEAFCASNALDCPHIPHPMCHTLPLPPTAIAVRLSRSNLPTTITTGTDPTLTLSHPAPCRLRVEPTVADGELLKAFELSRQKYKKKKELVRQTVLGWTELQLQLGWRGKRGEAEEHPGGGQGAGRGAGDPGGEGGG